MADTATSPEKLAEIRADEAPQEVAAPEPATESAEVSTSADAPEDAPMLDESGEDQTLKAVRQIEFYFADANLPYDKFMWTLHTANPEHWVPISTVASFKRMREFSSLGEAGLAEALKSSAALEVDETNTKVRRRTEVTEPKGQFERSVYAKGFGEEVPGLQKKLEDFFNQYGRTNAVRMRREENTKLFKSSVFVEFDDMSAVEKFLSADPKPTWEGKELLIMSKEAYCDMKIKEKGLTGKAANLRKQSMVGSGRKGFNAFREMENAIKEKSKPKPEVYMEFMGQKIRVYDEDGGTIKNEDVPFVKGATLKFEGVEGDVSFDEVKAPLKERFSRAPFVQFNRGDSWGYVAFDKQLSEEDLTYVKEKLKTLGAKEITWTYIDEEAEKAMQLERAASSAKRALHYAQNGDRGTGRGRGRGGRGGRGSRGGRGGRGRGARGGRGGDRNAEKGEGKEEQAGEKRKRAVEPNGGPDTGVRGQAVPTIQSAKKAKTTEDS